MDFRDDLVVIKDNMTSILFIDRKLKGNVVQFHRHTREMIFLIDKKQFRKVRKIVFNYIKTI